MTTEGLPRIATLKRSLARDRVLGQPVLEWLFNRLVVTEDVLRDSARQGCVDQEECREVLRANGCEGSHASAGLVRGMSVTACDASCIAPRNQKPAVLLVDDDQLLLRTMKRMLRACYDVSISTNPDDALRVLNEQHIDVIVSDYEIPNTRGGLWLLGEVSEQHPEVVRILISSRAMPHAIAGCEVAHRFVHKSAGIEGLMRHITECLQGAETRSVRAYMALNLQRYILDKLGDAEAGRLFDELAPATQNVLLTAKPADWCPRSVYEDLVHQVAGFAEGNQDRAREELMTVGEHMAREAANSYLRFPMKILNPRLFAKKLPDFWKRDFSWGRLDVDITEHRLVCRYLDLGRFDHSLCVGAGFLKFALQAMGKPTQGVVLRGWSLDQPYQDGSSIDLTWQG